MDPTVAGTTCVTSTINQAIHGPKSSAKPTVTLAEEAIGTDATYTDLHELDEPAVPVLGDTAHDGTEGPSFVHSMTVIPSPDTSDTAEQTEDTLEMETATGEQRDQDEPRVELPHDTNQASLESPSYVPPKIVIPSQDTISRVEGSGKVGERAWIPSTAIDAYLEMLSNHVNTIAGRAVVGVLSSSFWGWHGARFLLFGQREATFTSSGIMTILVPRLANGNHWQLVEIARKHKEIRVYCSMGFHMGSKDFSVCPAIDSCWVAYR